MAVYMPDRMAGTPGERQTIAIREIVDRLYNTVCSELTFTELQKIKAIIRTYCVWHKFGIKDENELNQANTVKKFMHLWKVNIQIDQIHNLADCILNLVRLMMQISRHDIIQLIESKEQELQKFGE